MDGFVLVFWDVMVLYLSFIKGTWVSLFYVWYEGQ